MTCQMRIVFAEPQQREFEMRNWAPKIIAVIVLLLLVWLLAPFATVPAGHRGVMTTFGTPRGCIFACRWHKS